MTWIQTYTGKKFYPANPNPHDIDIVDIAYSLAHQCRFTGHSQRFYSVAEHSVYVSEACPPEYKLWGLLHDATEAYLADIARPIKRLCPCYQQIELALMKAIQEKFNLPIGDGSELPGEVPSIVKRTDYRILANEQKALMPNAPEPWDLPDPLPVTYTTTIMTERARRGPQDYHMYWYDEFISKFTEYRRQHEKTNEA